MDSSRDGTYIAAISATIFSGSVFATTARFATVKIRTYISGSSARSLFPVSVQSLSSATTTSIPLYPFCAAFMFRCF